LQEQSAGFQLPKGLMVKAGLQNRVRVFLKTEAIPDLTLPRRNTFSLVQRANDLVGPARHWTTKVGVKVWVELPLVIVRVSL
jgi:hypothetical protein